MKNNYELQWCIFEYLTNIYIRHFMTIGWRQLASEKQPRPASSNNEKKSPNLGFSIESEEIY
jgi:hypothetical protein